MGAPAKCGSRVRITSRADDNVSNGDSAERRRTGFPRPLDTTADAHTLQGDIYRRLGGRARLDIMFRLSASIRHLAMSGIRARHPGYSDRQVLESYARLVWGDELARAVFPTGEPAEP